MKTIKETVKQALITIAGNQPIGSALLITSPEGTATHSTLDGTTIRVLGTSQIVRALRELPHVKRVNGHYIVKGRRVPSSKLDITQSEIAPKIEAENA